MQRATMCNYLLAAVASEGAPGAASPVSRFRFRASQAGRVRSGQQWSSWERVSPVARPA